MIFEVAFPIPLHKTFDYLVPSDLDTTDIVGRRVRVPFGRNFAVGIILNIKEQDSPSRYQIKPISEVIDSEPLLDKISIDLARWISVRYACSIGEALFSLLPPGKQFRDALVEEMPASHGEGHPGYPTENTRLTDLQKIAVDKIHDAIFSGTGGGFLIRGGSLSEKADVYFSAIRDALSQGKTALFLSPEIGPAIQASSWLKSRFGENTVSLWHSDLKPKSRWDEWRRIKQHEVSIVTGTRSAVMTPLSNIGVIIIDEEQDPAYKEERKPRFHARDVVFERARMNSAVVLLGSAAPSMEISQDIIDGKIQLIDVESTPAPHIEIVDMKAQRPRGALSFLLEKNLSLRLKAQEQSILFLNRRGFHRSLRCSECSWVARCLKCSVTLVHHKTSSLKKIDGKWKGGELHCHLCGTVSQPPAVCPECHKKKLKSTGYGTQRVAEEVQEKFPWCRVLLWDRDVASKKDEISTEKFVNGEFYVLVGTQLVAHGFHFPNVSLVGVVDADVPLHIPDFRAAERTFQLLMQMAGRAGRELAAGDMIIQTRNPDHYALMFAKNLDFPGFVEAELKYRSELNYPPFTHLVLIRPEDKNEKKGEAELERFVNWVRIIDAEGQIGVLGPTHASRSDRKGKKGLQLILKIPNDMFSKFMLSLRDYLKEKPSKLWFDADPQSLN